jgi:hypothetical protein
LDHHSGFGLLNYGEGKQCLNGARMVLAWCQNGVTDGVNDGARMVAGCLDHHSGFGLLNCGEGKGYQNGVRMVSE